MKTLRKGKSQAKVDTGKPIAALPKKSQKTSAASPGKPQGVSKPKAKKEEKVAKNDSSTVGKHSKRKSEIDDLFGQLKNVPRESKQVLVCCMYAVASIMLFRFLCCLCCVDIS
jgi:hypothetical protein